MATVHCIYLEIFNRIQSVTIVASGTKMNMSCWPVNGFRWTQRRRTLGPQSRESCSSLENTRYTLMGGGGDNNCCFYNVTCAHTHICMCVHASMLPKGYVRVQLISLCFRHDAKT